jgi:hypothetical protein
MDERIPDEQMAERATAVNSATKQNAMADLLGRWHRDCRGQRTSVRSNRGGAQSPRTWLQATKRPNEEPAYLPSS